MASRYSEKVVTILGAPGPLPDKSRAALEQWKRDVADEKAAEAALAGAPSQEDAKLAWDRKKTEFYQSHYDKLSDEAIKLVAPEAREGRIAESKWLRSQFCIRPMLKEGVSGELNFSYFEPKPDIVTGHSREWGDDQRTKLIELLGKHPFGTWAPYVAVFPAFSQTELRVKCARLLGSQSVERFKGQTFTPDAIKAEYAKNEQVGRQFNCWKGGVLVYDDGGQCLAALKQLDEAEQQNGQRASSSSSSSSMSAAAAAAGSKRKR